MKFVLRTSEMTLRVMKSASRMKCAAAHRIGQISFHILCKQNISYAKRVFHIGEADISLKL